MRETLTPCDVVKARKIEDCQGHPKPSDMRVGFSSPNRDTYFVFLYLGAETNAEPMEIEKRLNELGWFFQGKNREEKT